MRKIAAALSVTAALALTSFVVAQPEKSVAKEKAKGSVPNEHTMLTPSDLKWGDAPPFLPAGAKIAVLEGDPSKSGPFTIRLQAPAGYKIPAHTHPTAEKITVISGTFNLGMGPKLDETAGHELVAGSFAIMPAGMQHFAYAKEEFIVQVHGTGPFQIKYVNPTDDPRNAKK